MSLNDPNWGRGGSRGPQGPGGGNQGPPDLDELWRNFNRRLSELFGRRRRGGADEPPSPPSSWRFGGGAGALFALVLAVWLASGFYIVVEGQRGVVLTFGRFSQETGPGLRWRLPWPIQSNEIVNLQQVRTLEIGYRNNVRTKVLKESLMLTDAETMMREVIGKTRMDAILYETQVDIANKTRDLMQVIHDRYGTGIQISAVTVQNAQPPEQVQAAFDAAVKAGQDRERQKNEGQAYANDVIPRSRGAASRLLQEAEGYKQRVIANAEGEASRFKQVLAEYAKAPAVTRERIYIETMQQILASTSKVMMDFRGPGNLLYLPLDKLMQQGGSATPSESQASQRNAPEPAPPEAGPRNRETLRNRERGER